MSLPSYWLSLKATFSSLPRGLFPRQFTAVHLFRDQQQSCAVICQGRSYLEWQNNGSDSSLSLPCSIWWKQVTGPLTLKERGLYRACHQRTYIMRPSWKSASQTEPPLSWPHLHLDLDYLRSLESVSWFTIKLLKKATPSRSWSMEDLPWFPWPTPFHLRAFSSASSSPCLNSFPQFFHPSFTQSAQILSQFQCYFLNKGFLISRLKRQVVIK